jgi:hypothetical protein
MHAPHGPVSTATQGIGAAIGGMVGGLGGAVAGAHVGKIPGAMLEQFAKRWAQDRGLAQLSAAATRFARRGDEGAFAAVLGVDATMRLDATMQKISTTLRRMAIDGTATAAPRSNGHIRALGGDTPGISDEAAVGKLQKTIVDLSANPAALAHATSTVASLIAGHAPAVADEYAAQLARAVAYLAAAVPKPSAPPGLFGVQTWQPSRSATLAWHDKAEIVHDPMAAMRHMEQGTLSMSHLDALKTVYPVIYGKMRQTIMQFAADHPGIKLPAAQRASVSRFLGAPTGLLESPAALKILQGASVPALNAAPQTDGRKNPKLKGPAKGAPPLQTTWGSTAVAERAKD